ncbi:hypothetical protein BCY86_08255 [Pajaroellobacter abortibovis]|uniref:Uncharacterized protein n=1 Tax=Pajaroellobacter abortibovis TaxID=1882918 RepID=A0A1L6MYT4_9BACT|nr:hypothetical protein BCY86_08255 [Pajaroellobacter abortibovis]
MLRGGVRLDGLSYSTRDGSGHGTERGTSRLHIGKKAIFDWNFVQYLHAILSYGEGFRSPQARSLTDGETAPFTKVNSYEIGLGFLGKKCFQARLHFSEHNSAKTSSSIIQQGTMNVSPRPTVMVSVLTSQHVLSKDSYRWSAQY